MNRDTTCYRNISNLCCIDLLLTISSKNFESTCSVATDLWDFHKLLSRYLIRNPNGWLQNLYSTEIINSLTTQFSIIVFEKKKKLNLSKWNFATIRKIFMEILDKFPPSKKKYIGANHSKFVTKRLNKAIMLRSKLRN